MPFNNRYIVAALDSSGEQIAVLSPALEWTKSLEAAVCFPSQQDANQYIEKNNVNSVSRIHELKNFDHVQSVFVTVKNNNALESEHVPDDVISFTGIYG